MIAGSRRTLSIPLQNNITPSRISCRNGSKSKSFTWILQNNITPSRISSRNSSKSTIFTWKKRDTCLLQHRLRAPELVELCQFESCYKLDSFWRFVRIRFWALGTREHDVGTLVSKVSLRSEAILHLKFVGLEISGEYGWLFCWPRLFSKRAYPQACYLKQDIGL